MKSLRSVICISYSARHVFIAKKIDCVKLAQYKIDRIPPLVINQENDK